ncbi:unnamed protein product [Polarella glacialis]|uniref:ATP synthase subunit a n=1 Tax=Polarella glacialis TaxID=89957 RepID=A0A813DAT0_POLGL|nr:unnamed protein product [Polarella glacialis]
MCKEAWCDVSLATTSVWCLVYWWSSASLRAGIASCHLRLSLSFCLFGNIMANELTVAVLTFLVPFVIPLPIMALGVFAGSIQALIFSILAFVYNHEALE